MFSIDVNTKEIYTIKGDTANFKMSIAPYELKTGDKLIFTVKKRYGAPVVITKEADADGQFHIAHEDYDNVAPGYYLYDIQLTTAEGEVYTVVGPANITIDIEITADEPVPDEPTPEPSEEDNNE